MWRNVLLPYAAPYLLGAALGVYAVNLCRVALLKLYDAYKYLRISSCSNDIIERLLIVGLSVSPFTMYIAMDSVLLALGFICGVVLSIMYYNKGMSRNVKVNVFHRNYHMQYWYNTSEVPLQDVYDRIYAEFEYDKVNLANDSDIRLTLETGYSEHVHVLSVDTMTVTSLFNSDVYNLNQKSFDFFGFKTISVFLKISKGAGPIINANAKRKACSDVASPSHKGINSPTLVSRFISTFPGFASSSEKKAKGGDASMRADAPSPSAPSPSKLTSSIRRLFRSSSSRSYLKHDLLGDDAMPAARDRDRDRVPRVIDDFLVREKEGVQDTLDDDEGIYSFKFVEAEMLGSNCVGDIRRSSSSSSLTAPRRDADLPPHLESSSASKVKTPQKVNSAFKRMSMLQHTTTSGKAREVLYEPPDGTKYVDYFMNRMLSDTTGQDLQVSGIPANILKKFYTIAVRQVLKQCFKIIFSLNGKPLFGHHLEVEILEDCHESGEYLDMKPDIDREAINSLVGVLLEDKAINLTWLPDNVEANLYENIIVIMFYVVNCFFRTSSFNIIGHTIGAVLKKSGAGLDRLAMKISQQRRQIDDTLLEKDVERLIRDSNFGKEDGDRWLTNALGKSIYKTMCALSLCIVDQVLLDMKVRFLGDICVYHLVPGSMPPNPRSSTSDANGVKKSGKK